MPHFFKNNRLELLVSLVLSIIIYFILARFLPVAIVCAPGQPIQCLAFGWGVILVIISVLLVLIYLVIKVVEFLKRRFF